MSSQVENLTAGGLRQRPTPKQHLYVREGGGGKEFVYVKQGYVMSWLDENFPVWSFEILKEWEDSYGHVNVLGKLTVLISSGDASIERVATSIGTKELTVARNSGTVVKSPYYKAAETDSLKRCARYFGCANDIYMGEDLDDIEIVSDEQAADFVNNYLPAILDKLTHNKLTPTQVLNLVKNYTMGTISIEQIQSLKEL